MRTTYIMAACAVLAALGGTVNAASAQGREERREVRRFAMAPGGGGSIGVQVKDAGKGGAAVEDVLEESPAARAGLKAGDIVVEFDGERVRSARQFARLVDETPESRTVKVVVTRSGAKQTMEVTPVARRGERAWLGDLGPRMRDGMERGLREFAPGRRLDFDAPVGPGIVPGPERPRLGVGVEPLGEQLAAYFGAKEGVLVASVDDGSPAAKAGLKAGDVITAVNGAPVADPGDLTSEVRKARPGSTLSLEIVREKKTQTVKATLPDAPRRQPVRDRLTARRH